jgi:hypothetical protein
MELVAMRALSTVLKSLAAWRDWLADLGDDGHVASDPIGGAVTDTEDDATGGPATERFERSLYIYGLPPM